MRHFLAQAGAGIGPLSRLVAICTFRARALRVMAERAGTVRGGGGGMHVSARARGVQGVHICLARLMLFIRCGSGGQKVGSTLGTRGWGRHASGGCCCGRATQVSLAFRGAEQIAKAASQVSTTTRLGYISRACLFLALSVDHVLDSHSLVTTAWLVPAECSNALIVVLGSTHIVSVACGILETLCQVSVTAGQVLATASEISLAACEVLATTMTACQISVTVGQILVAMRQVSSTQPQAGKV